jgi:hypothetical protein
VGFVVGHGVLVVVVVVVVMGKGMQPIGTMRPVKGEQPFDAVEQILFGAPPIPITAKMLRQV